MTQLWRNCWLLLVFPTGCGNALKTPELCTPSAVDGAGVTRTLKANAQFDGGTVLPNGRILRIPTEYVRRFDRQLGHPVDMVSHPRLPIVYVADARYGGGQDSRRCSKAAPRRGIHVVDIENGNELQGPDAPDTAELQLPQAPLGLYESPYVCPESTPLAGQIPRDGAFGLAINRDGTRLYASTGISGYVLEFLVDGAGWLRPAHAIQVGGFTAGLALAPPDETSLFVVRFLGPKAEAVSTVAEIALAASSDIPQLAANDFVPQLLSSELPLVGFGAYDCLARQEGTGLRLWVSGFRAGKLQTAYRESKNPFGTLETLDVGKNPEGLAPYGNSGVLVAVSDADELVALDADYGHHVSISKRIAVGRYPDESFRPTVMMPGASPSQVVVNGNRAYVTLATDNALSIVNLDHGREEGVINVGLDPSAVALSPSGKVVVAMGKKPYGPSCPAEATDCQLTLQPAQDQSTDSDDCWSSDAQLECRYLGPPLCHNGVPSRNDVERMVYFKPEKQDGTLAVVTTPGVLLDATKIARKHIQEPVGKYEPQCEGKLFPVPPPGGMTLTPIQHVFLVVRENKTYDFLLGDLKHEDKTPKGDGYPALAVDGIRLANGWPPITPNLHALATRFTSLDNFYDDAEVSMQGHSWATSSFVNDYLERIHLEENSKSAFFDFPFDMEPAMPGAEPGFGSFFEHLLKHGVSFAIYNEAVGVLGNFGDDYVASHLDLHNKPQDLDVSDLKRVEHIADQLNTATDWAAFTFILLPRDHTSGLTPGALSPISLIAENDLATGEFVKALSHNANLWKSSVVFLVEDDSQQGYDHVDYHRSICLVISPWAKADYNSSVHASYPALFKTIETILGIGSMNRFDEYAPVMWDAFQAAPEARAFRPFDSICAKVPLDAKNPATCSTGDSCNAIVANVADLADDENAGEHDNEHDDAVVIDGRPDIDQAVWSAVTNSEIGEGTYRD